MYTIISSTSRPNSNSSIVSNYIKSQLNHIESKDIKFIDLAEINIDKYHADFYNLETRDDFWTLLQDEILIPSQKFIFIIPEYNGGIPGMLKSFIDVLSIYERDATFKNKKALLIGIAAGRAGNLRGIESFTSILNYLGTTVYPSKQPISGVHTLISEGVLSDKATKEILDNLLLEFKNY